LPFKSPSPFTTTLTPTSATWPADERAAPAADTVVIVDVNVRRRRRRIAIQRSKLARNYLAFLHLASVLVWLA